MIYTVIPELVGPLTFPFDRPSCIQVKDALVAAGDDRGGGGGGGGDPKAVLPLTLGHDEAVVSVKEALKGGKSFVVLATLRLQKVKEVNEPCMLFGAGDPFCVIIFSAFDILFNVISVSPPISQSASSLPVRPVVFLRLSRVKGV